MTRIYFDVETHPIAPSALAPRLVCSQWLSEVNNKSDAQISDREVTRLMLEGLLPKSDLVWIGAGIHFDFAVICANWPEMIPTVFALYEQHRVEDVQIRDKLLMLGLHGYVDSAPTPSGGSQRITYSLAALADRRLGVQLAGKDEEGEDRWRVNFRELEGIPVAEWPEEPREYALSDVRLLPEIYAKQEELPRAHPAHDRGGADVRFVAAGTGPGRRDRGEVGVGAADAKEACLREQGSFGPLRIHSF